MMKEFEIIRELLPKLNCDAEIIEKFLGASSNILNEYRDIILKKDKIWNRDVECLGFRGFTNYNTLSAKFCISYIGTVDWDSRYMVEVVEIPLEYLYNEDILINIRQKKKEETK